MGIKVNSVGDFIFFFFLGDGNVGSLVVVECKLYGLFSVIDLFKVIKKDFFMSYFLFFFLSGLSISIVIFRNTLFLI